VPKPFILRKYLGLPFPAVRTQNFCSMTPRATKYRIGAYEIRVRTHELYKDNTKLKLRPQAFQVLEILLQRSPDVVTREEFRLALWSSETFVDFDYALNTCIKELRGVLSDSAREPRYIETIPKVGYRLVVPVEKVTAEIIPEAQVTSIPSTPSEETESGPIERPHRLRLIIAAIPLLLLAAAIIYWKWPSRPQVATNRIILAVLPFENLTGDPTQDYFSDGLTEEMISQLGRLDPSRLGVIARTSVMHYKHSQAPLGEIGHELGVSYILEGSVRRDSNSLRVSAQLIQVKDQTHLWARQYDRELSNLLNLQGEIAQEVADGIQLALGDRHRPSHAPASENLSATMVEAYDLYLRGRYFWNQRNTEGLAKAAESFKQALVKDPSYAPAYAGLADTYALLGQLNPQMKPHEIMPQARAAALKALQLDERLAEAHTSLALISENYDYDWQTAETEFRRAIELNPNYATAHHWYAEYLMWLGRQDEALQENARARQLDPLSLIIAADRGAILYYSRQYDRAIEQFKEVLAVDPHFGRATAIYSAYLRKGMFSEALADSDKDLSHCASDPWICAWLAYVYGIAGRRDQARPALEELERLDRSQYVHPDSLITAYIALGRTDDAFRYLEKAYSERSNVLTALRVDPVFDPLRGDRRFRDLLLAVHLAE
jgi:TolB-like protein/DNA-binding winged helix-turn-helix (wHTH) protein/Tfp pilus assembly protein PilF